MRIYLIRHGKTEANLKHLYCGSTDLSLSEVGKGELEKTKPLIRETLEKYQNSLRFISSGMKRCNETLEMLFGDVEFEVRSDFREIDFGIFEMHSYEELKDDPDYQNWISGDNQANVPPKGESGNQMKARVMKTFYELAEEKMDAVVVSHGGVIAAIMEELFSEEEKNLYQWQPKPGAGYCLEWQENCWNYGDII